MRASPAEMLDWPAQSVFVAPLEKEFGWTRAQTSLPDSHAGPEVDLDPLGAADHSRHQQQERPDRVAWIFVQGVLTSPRAPIVQSNGRSDSAATESRR